MSAVLDVENLAIEIPLATGMLHPVRGISFKVERGETLAIVGESGCGKSVNSLAVMRLVPQPAGEIVAGWLFDSKDKIYSPCPSPPCEI